MLRCCCSTVHAFDTGVEVKLHSQNKLSDHLKQSFTASVSTSVPRTLCSSQLVCIDPAAHAELSDVFVGQILNIVLVELCALHAGQTLKQLHHVVTFVHQPERSLQTACKKPKTQGLPPRVFQQF